MTPYTEPETLPQAIVRWQARERRGQLAQTSPFVLLLLAAATGLAIGLAAGRRRGA
jgi:hypothetical protein